MKKLLYFVKYNNAFPIFLLGLIAVSGAVFAASPKIRESLSIGSNEQKTPVPQKTDTAMLEKFDAKHFSYALKIQSMTDTGDAYSIRYGYQTLEIINDAWKPIQKTNTLIIPKERLVGTDLASYLGVQLGQVLDQESRYLSEARDAKRMKDSHGIDGEYAGLIGSEYDSTRKQFAGFDSEQTKNTNQESAKSTDTSPIGQVTEKIQDANASGPIVSKQEIREMIVQAVTDFLSIESEMPTGNGSGVPVIDADQNQSVSAAESPASTAVPVTKNAADQIPVSQP